MTDDTDALIARLSTGVRPVGRLARPQLRALWWLAAVSVLAVGLAARADLASVAARIGSAPDMWLAVVGSTATAILAGLAAMMVALPDRDARWSLLPLPAAVLWLAASGAGCLRGDLLGGLHPATFADATENCLPFILEFSVVLGVPLGLLLWRAQPLRPGLVAWTGGLAVAAAAASLLWFVHPFEASLADLVVHAAAVGVVMLAVRGLAVLLPR